MMTLTLQFHHAMSWLASDWSIVYRLFSVLLASDQRCVLAIIGGMVTITHALRTGTVKVVHCKLEQIFVFSQVRQPKNSKCSQFSVFYSLCYLH